MKKLFLMAFLVVSMTANAETIVTNDDVQVENVGGVDLGKGADEDDRWSMHIAVGVDIPVSTNGLDFAPFRSWDINWTVVQYDWTPKNAKTTLSAGLGLNWRNYTLSGHDMMFVKGNDVVGVIGREGKMSELSSRVHTQSLSMPLLIKQHFGKNFAISLGAQLNWNYYARLSNYYEMDDHEIDDQTKKIGERPITIDILGIVHIAKGFGVYCKYSPMSVFKKDKGPDFKSLSVGFYF
ncbi:MAG: hypothetical protein J6W05_00370 [Prevotella sp.]|jgi:hypothetical protein|nr:hypothetical protein [Prevotella sp.]